jgi:hypothetical protein
LPLTCSPFQPSHNSCLLENCFTATIQDSYPWRLLTSQPPRWGGDRCCLSAFRAWSLSALWHVLTHQTPELCHAPLGPQVALRKHAVAVCRALPRTRRRHLPRVIGLLCRSTPGFPSVHPVVPIHVAPDALDRLVRICRRQLAHEKQSLRHREGTHHLCTGGCVACSSHSPRRTRSTGMSAR